MYPTERQYLRRRFAITPIRIVRDLQFAPSLRADLFVPERPHARPPLIVWVHGGGWRFGSRQMAPDLSRFFAASGFAMAAVDYRLTTTATFPAQIEDLKTAIRWLRRVAPEHGLDVSRLGLWGASAGGHLAALAALATDGLFEPPDAAYRDQPSTVQAVAIGYAPIDFLQLDAYRAPAGTPSSDPETLELPPGMRSADPDSYESLLMGAPIETCPDRVRRANPVTFVHAGAPPFLILHGLSDTTIAEQQSELFYDALAGCGNEVTLCLIEGLGHGFLNRTHLDEGPARRMTVRTRSRDGERVEHCAQPIFPMIEAFFRRHLTTDRRANPQPVSIGR